MPLFFLWNSRGRCAGLNEWCVFASDRKSATLACGKRNNNGVPEKQGLGGEEKGTL